MKRLNEIVQRPDDWLGATVMDLQHYVHSVRPASAAGMIVTHTQDGVIHQPDPLDIFTASREYVKRVRLMA